MAQAPLSLQGLVSAHLVVLVLEVGNQYNGV
jgi:hypothetical protein